MKLQIDISAETEEEARQKFNNSRFCDGKIKSIKKREWKGPTQYTILFTRKTDY